MLLLALTGCGRLSEIAIMKLALICFSVLTSLSLSFGVQEKAALLECRETQAPCDYWQKQLQGRKQELKTWND